MREPIKMECVLAFDFNLILITFSSKTPGKCEWSRRPPCEQKVEPISANIGFQPKPNCGLVAHCTLSVPVQWLHLIQLIAQKI